MAALQSLPASATSSIDRRPCSRCKARMVLARVRPAKPGFDLCTFDCMKCDRTERIMLQAASD
jgi:RNase P subunit RPR2